MSRPPSQSFNPPRPRRQDRPKFPDARIPDPGRVLVVLDDGRVERDESGMPVRFFPATRTPISVELRCSRCGARRPAGELRQDGARMVCRKGC